MRLSGLSDCAFFPLGLYLYTTLLVGACVCVWFGLTLRPAAHHRPLGSKTVASKPLSPLWSVCVSGVCVHSFHPNILVLQWH